MNNALTDQVVRAVLYEGYILYPYRPSVKNSQRWTFGGLYPRTYSEAHGGSDAWTMQTECLVQTGPETALDVTVRFLHLVARQVGERVELADGTPSFRPVPALQVGGRRYQTWQEAVERQVPLGAVPLAEFMERPREQPFRFAAGGRQEPLRDDAGEVVGVLTREQQAIEGTVELSAVAAGEGLARVTVRIFNRTRLEDVAGQSRDDALMRALVSTHTVLGVSGGQFVSLLDPPEAGREAAVACRNVGTWPVLVGADGERDAMLSSPIILYDYPQVAPESPGDLFDGTEIDEILTLRILTLTADEKAQAAAVDERARALLERTEALARDQLLRLHGTVRDLRPVEAQP
jgi:hydrogenase maturation protease